MCWLVRTLNSYSHCDNVTNAVTVLQARQGVTSTVGMRNISVNVTATVTVTVILLQKLLQLVLLTKKTAA